MLGNQNKNTKIMNAKEIADLKERVAKLERKSELDTKIHASVQSQIISLYGMIKSLHGHLIKTYDPNMTDILTPIIKEP
jgi:hypothetical protein